jgi:hypothetical protein
MGDPLELGVAKKMLAAPLLGAATNDVGVSGTLSGITGLEESDGKELPTAFVATALNAYAVPETSGETTHEVAGVSTVQLTPPGVDVIVKRTTGSPPLLARESAEVLIETVALLKPAVTVSIVGELGTFAGVTEAEAVELSEVPTALVARATKV